MKQKFILFLMLCCSFQLSFAHAKSSKMPQLTMRTIKNDTPYDFVITDRFNKRSFEVPAHRETKACFAIKNYKNVVINGSMAACMADNAQFIIEQKPSKSSSQERKTYLNMSLVPGGVNDGSGIISGVQGSIGFKFFMAGAKRGCAMSSSQIQNNACKEVEIDLELSVDEEDEKQNNFRLYVSADLTEK